MTVKKKWLIKLEKDESKSKFKLEVNTQASSSGYPSKQKIYYNYKNLIHKNKIYY